MAKKTKKSKVVKRSAEEADSIDEILADESSVESGLVELLTGSKAPVPENSISLTFSKDELEMMTNVLNNSAGLYDMLAKQSLIENNEDNSREFLARGSIAKAIALRFSSYIKIGEPTSRLIH